MNIRARGIIEMTTAMTISGSIGWFVIASGQPVSVVVFWRCVFGAITLMLVCASRGLLKNIPPPRVIGLAALGGVAIVLNWVLLFESYALTSISIATVVYNTQPFMLVTLGTLFLSERLTVSKVLWLVIAFAGTLLIIRGGPISTHSGATYRLGVLMALGGAFLYAVAALITKQLTGTSPYLITLIQTSVGVLLLAPYAQLSSRPTMPAVWGMLITVGVVHTGLVLTLLYGAIQKLPTYLTGSLSFIYPIVACVVDFTAFGKRLLPAQVIGAVVILTAAAGTTLGWSLWRPRILAS